MTTNTIACDRSRLEPKTRPIGNSLPDDGEALDDAKIANLSLLQISQMAGDELVRVIRASRLPLLTTASDEHLEFHDRKTLERLVHLGRRCCHHRTTAAPSWRPVSAGGQ